MSEMSNEDRISVLPDGVLLHILCFLDMKEMVRSSVLSKRWRNTWTYTPTLTFENNASLLNNKFVKWVNRTLKQLPSCTSIEKFKVEFNYINCFAGDVDAWARFASERKVKDLVLSFLRPCTCCQYVLYRAPQFLLGNSSIINLSLRGCKVMPGSDFSWRSLRVLSIEGSLLDDRTIAKILSSCPMLEDLTLSATKGLCHLHIGSQSLRHLEIQLNPGEASESLEISAPRLQGLCLLGSLHTRTLLVRAPSLVRAKVNFSLHIGCNQLFTSYVVIPQLFGSFCQVKELELNRQNFQTLIISLLSRRGLLSPLSSLTCLKLNANIDKGDVPSIIILLICSPNLEKFVLTETQNGSKPSSRSIVREQQFEKYLRTSCCLSLLNYWRTSSKGPNEKLRFPHLDTLKFIGFEKLQEVVESIRRIVEFGENALTSFYASIDHHL